ncbi:MAG: ribosome biogenesis GTP-binding protein YihA/YsxC [Desulfarculales bacterium]|jgi:GTP-binding protein|nr:ribosome biogenesis GTP-binding protein YihA/YsxC [Desulfarculales bacterium]
MNKIIIKQAEFIAGAPNRRAWPPSGGPEVAFVGRSNVGKSSLINRLVMRKKLVRTSSRPGCTQQINFFSFNSDAFRFIDLPGYGFARVPWALKKSWPDMIADYLRERETLRGVVIIFDVRREINQDDKAILVWLRKIAAPFLPVLTKTDKVSRGQMMKNFREWQKSLAPYGTEPLLFSSVNGEGMEKLWEALAPWLFSAPDSGG